MISSIFVLCASILICIWMEWDTRHANLETSIFKMVCQIFIFIFNYLYFIIVLIFYKNPFELSVLIGLTLLGAAFIIVAELNSRRWKKENEEYWNNHNKRKSEKEKQKNETAHT